MYVSCVHGSVVSKRTRETRDDMNPRYVLSHGRGAHDGKVRPKHPFQFRVPPYMLHSRPHEPPTRPNGWTYAEGEGGSRGLDAC